MEPSKIQDCLKCDISARRKNIVNGHGNINAPIMFVGEAPGYYEDKTGIPFVGKSGQLLTACIERVGMKRDWFYITNCIRCRPDGNRTPTNNERFNCLPYLIDDIKAIQPKLYVALGKIACTTLLGIDIPVHRARNKVFFTKTLKAHVLVTFHPSYILMNPNKINDFLLDMYIISRYYKKYINNYFISKPYEDIIFKKTT